MVPKFMFFNHIDIIFNGRLSLFFIINVLLCADICRSSNEEILKDIIPASLNQTKELATAVCWELFPAQRSMCEKRFLTQKRHISHKIVVELQCQSKNTIFVSVPPSKEFKLVILINNEDKTEDINYSLIEPDKKYGSVYAPSGNYDIWSTTINKDGVPSLWKRGRTIKPWESVEKLILPKMYDIKINFLYDKYDNQTHLIDTSFTWNTSAYYDSCFDVLNYCNNKTQGDHFHRKIIPDQNHTAQVPNLPLDDTCTIKVIGVHGTTKKVYRTPFCRDIVGCTPSPDKAQNITVDAMERGDGWSVRVRWDPPRDVTINYNVTLITDREYSATMTGNVTEILFDGVSGDGDYMVRVLARTVFGTSIAYETKTFPRRSAGSVVGVLCGVVVLLSASMMAVALCWRRRTRHPRYLYKQGVLDKFGEDGDVNVDPESGSEDTWEVRPERLLLHEVVGEGAFGVVRRGTLAPSDRDVAVKMLKEYPSAEEVRSFRAEMELMKSVGAHAHVVSLLGCCSGRRPLIVAEYCARGDLLSYLRCSWDMMVSRRNAKYYNNNKENYRNDLFKSKPTDKFVANRLYDIQGVCDAELTMLDLLSFCRQIALGMEFLASNRVVHRDLAARNVVVTGDRTLKIADFGLSRDVYQENQYKQKGNGKMPVKWMALESLTHRIYTTQSDVWSFGVVVWEVVTVGGAPYAGVGAARLPRLLAAGYRMPRPHNCGPALYELMLSCWVDRARRRPTFSELVVRLDALLCASADHYLSLALPLPDDAPDPPPQPYRYIRMLLAGKRGRGKSYDRPLAPTNHYTKQPAAVPASASAPAPTPAPPYSTHTQSTPTWDICKGT